MPEVVTVLVADEFVVLVPVALVCQYQATLAGGVPLADMVTPGTEHCGEFEVGPGGVAGTIATADPFKVTLSFVQLVLLPLALIRYILKVTELKLEKEAAGKVTTGVCEVVVAVPVEIFAA